MVLHHFIAIVSFATTGMHVAALALETPPNPLRSVMSTRPVLEQPSPGEPLSLQRLVSGLLLPIFATAPLGDPRLFVVEKGGRIMIVPHGGVEPVPFLDIRECVDSMGERGLLGLAFDPAFHRNGRFYVCYSRKDTTDTVVSRFTTVIGNSDCADPSSEQRILIVPQRPERTDHKAGWIGFRPGEPDYLYIAIGDGGGSNDPENSAQNLRSYLGKILRINVSGNESGYTIPKDNPLVGSDSAIPEIWAFGLRNPYRVSFDRDTGDLYIADVGQDSTEEINFEPASCLGGRNYGWRQREGRRDTPGVNETISGTTEPLLDYSHSEMLTQRGAVIGGYVYRGRKLPELDGAYLFADFPNAVVRSFRRKGDEVTQYTDHTDQLNRGGQLFFYSSVASFAEDGDGELLLVDLTGSIFRIVRGE